ncbi:MAG TPA: hypothetical protein VN622_12315, partial [Clostridia bacterium]|nr:hypothetical protein [Clostridia bacterium]
DANETPIPGARSVVQFNILPPRSTSAPPAARPGGMAYNTDAPIVRMASVAGPPIDGDPQNEDGLPSSGGALPLLSVIGFGVLLGGVASAMRTR